MEFLVLILINYRRILISQVCLSISVTSEVDLEYRSLALPWARSLDWSSRFVPSREIIFPFSFVFSAASAFRERGRPSLFMASKPEPSPVRIIVTGKCHDMLHEHILQLHTLLPSSLLNPALFLRLKLCCWI